MSEMQYQFLSKEENEVLFKEGLDYLRSKGYIIQEPSHLKHLYAVVRPGAKSLELKNKSQLIGIWYNEVNKRPAQKVASCCSG